MKKIILFVCITISFGIFAQQCRYPDYYDKKLRKCVRYEFKIPQKDSCKKFRICMSSVYKNLHGYSSGRRGEYNLYVAFAAADYRKSKCRRTFKKCAEKDCLASYTSELKGLKSKNMPNVYKLMSNFITCIVKVYN